MTRDIERGVRGIESLISFSLFNVFATLIEVILVLSVLAVKFDAWFAWITLTALVLYIVYTVLVTEWRTKFRREANEFDSAAHTKAVDSLLNYETVKYFNNEGFEARRYDESLERLRRARLKSQTTLSMLNAGQQLIIAVGLVAMLWRATQGVVDGRMTLGDLVMVNAFMIQLYILPNSPGRDLPRDQAEPRSPGQDVRADGQGARGGRCPGAQPLHGLNSLSRCGLKMRTLPTTPCARPFCKGVMEIPRGQDGGGGGAPGLASPAWRGCCSGSLRYPAGSHHHCRARFGSVTQSSVRQAIGIVPQDTVLFNDTVVTTLPTEAARGHAARGRGRRALRASTTSSPPRPRAADHGGRTGPKLGGDPARGYCPQCCSRTCPSSSLTRPPALDNNERAIQAELQSAAQNKRTLLIAHRLHRGRARSLEDGRGLHH